MQNNNSKEGESTATEPKKLNLGAEAKAEKQKLSKKEIKQEKKAKKETKSNVNALTSSIISEMDSPTLEKTKEVSGMGDDTEMVSVFKVQSTYCFTQLKGMSPTEGRACSPLGSYTGLLWR